MDRFNFPWFHCKAPEFLKNLCLNEGKAALYKKGAIVAHYDLKPQTIDYIAEGVCTFVEYNASGMSRSLGLLTDGASYNEIPAIMGDYLRFDIKAMQDIKVYTIHIDKVYTALEKNLAYTKSMLDYVCRKLNFIENIRSAFVDLNTQQRLAVFLKSYVEYTRAKPNIEGDYIFAMKLTHDQIAEILFTSRVSVSILLKYLKKASYINTTPEGILFRSSLITNDTIYGYLNELSWHDIRGGIR